MEQMLAVMADNPSATLAGLVGMACLAVWPLFQARPMMLTAYIGNNLSFALHYAFLDHWTAVAMNGLMGVQTVAAIGLARYPRLRLAYLAFIPFMAGVTIATWQGLPSLLAATATTLSTAGRMQCSETLLRVLLLAAMPFWAIHDLAVGSLPGLAADLISMAVGAAMLCACRRRRGAPVSPARSASPAG